MAAGTNPRDYARQVTINDSAWTEVVIVNPCASVEVRQLPTETQAPISVKHRSDDVGEAAEVITAGEKWWKGHNRAKYNTAKLFQAGDTIGFFQRASGVGNITLMVRELEV